MLKAIRFLILFFIFVYANLFAPAKAKGFPADQPRQGGTETKAISIAKSNRTVTPSVLRMALDAAKPGALDPHFAAATQDRAVADMIFNGLIRYEPGNSSKMEPDLAESLPKSEMVGDKQVWTFTIRKGVMFHPGPKTEAYELTADDVVYSLRKSADPARSAYAGEYTGMTVEEVDKYTVRITMVKPLSTVLFLPKVTNYAGGFIVSKKALEAMGDQSYRLHPVGTGPFMFKSYTSNEKIQLVANKQYFRGRPLLNAVDVFYFPDIKSRERGLVSGNLDLISGSIEAEWIGKMEKEKGIKIDVHGVGEVVTIHFNVTAKPLNDIRVRKATTYALDRNKFIEIFGRNICRNVYSPVPAQFLQGGLTEKEIKLLGLDYALNIAKARQLLAEAGFPDGFSLNIVTSEKREYRDNYESIQKQLTRIGINLNIKVTDHSTMHKLIRQNMNPIVIYVAWRPNADVYLTRFFHSDSIVVSGAKPDTNFSHYDKIDNLIEAGRLEINSENQIKLWKHAQIKILEDMVALPLHYRKQIYIRKIFVDYGHELVSSMALYPQITEKTRIIK